ncbi:MAG: prepilin-type N-terminal cleavage/methylation domain-containing protein [Firmicutes bacterium]|nr:prepilin-type N-terminal cleavage/methylation domain-containing protein [Bacillota bacterium]
MKLNKKGVTIIELIVSIALISVVMLFMYQLLADVTFQKDNDYIATVNQRQRIDMINKIEKSVQKMIKKYQTTGDINIYTYGNSSYGVKVKINGKDRVKLEIKTSKTILELYEYDETVAGSNKLVLLETWTIKGGTFASKEDIGNLIIQKKASDYGTNISMWQCTIPIYTENINNKMLKYQINGINKNENNNNTLDDITFSAIVKT